MTITISTKVTLIVLTVIAWILFLGVCVDAGGIVFNAIFAAGFDSPGTSTFWGKVDLTELLRRDRGNFIVMTILMSIVAILKAIMFYLILRLLSKNQLSFRKPFNIEVRWFLLSMAFLSLGIGMFSQSGSNYSQWLKGKGIAMPEVQEMSIGGADVWLFMGIILLVIAQIFKRGIEIQTENDLTV
jgi:hypothetical protein